VAGQRAAAIHPAAPGARGGCQGAAQQQQQHWLLCRCITACMLLAQMQKHLPPSADMLRCVHGGGSRQSQWLPRSGCCTGPLAMLCKCCTCV
jgi:hypothetical protein